MVQPISQSTGLDTKEGQATASGRLGNIFWLAWVFATAVGYAAGWMLGKTFADAVRNFVAVMVGFSLINGTVVGALQGLVLQWRISRVSLWLLANVVGVMVSGFSGDPVGATIHWLVGDHPGFSWAPWASSGFVMGAVIGILQGLALRWRDSRAVLWVFANVVGYAAGWVAGYYILFRSAILSALPYTSLPWTWGSVVAIAVGGVVAGIITGTALVWLSRHPAPSAAPSGVNATFKLNS